MAVRLQVPKKAALVRFVLHPWGRAFLIGFVAINTLLLALFTFSYVKYSRQIDEKLLGGPFTNTSMLFAAPQVVMVGDQLTADEIATARSGEAVTRRRRRRVAWVGTTCGRTRSRFSLEPSRTSTTKKLSSSSKTTRSRR